MGLWDEDTAAVLDQELLAELEAIRERRRLTKAEFGGLMGVSPQHWSNILHGHRPLSRSVLDRINVLAPGPFERYYRRQHQRRSLAEASA